MATLLGSAAWLEEVAQTRSAFLVLAAQCILVDHRDGHPEPYLARIGLYPDQVALDRAAAFEIDDGGDVRHLDSGQGAVHDRISVEGPRVGQRTHLHLIAGAAFRANVARANE